MLGRYCRLACSQHANFLVLENTLGQFLAHKGCLFVPKTLVPTVLQELHDARGHFGVNRTYAMIAEWYYWPRMGDAVRGYCHRCNICQHNKSDTRKLAGLY